MDLLYGLMIWSEGYQLITIHRLQAIYLVKLTEITSGNLSSWMCEIHPMTSPDQSHSHIQGIRPVIVIAHDNTTRKEIANTSIKYAVVC